MRDAVFGLAAAVIACSPDQSISGPPSLLLNSSQPVCQQSAAVWLNNALAAQTGSFTAQFDATPNGAAIAGVVGLSAGAAGAYTDLAPIVAFNLAGQINARNGGAYAAVNVIPYTAGTSYHFRLVVGVPSRTCSAYVTPFGGTEVTIGSGYAFRTEQSAVTALANWAAYTSTGTLTLCNFSLGWQSAAVWLNNGFAAQTGSFTVQFDATPNGAAIVGVVGLSAGAAGAYTDLAPIVAFTLAGQINARNGGAYAAVNVIPYTPGTSYHFRLVVDLPSRTYSAYLTPFGGTEGTIGSGYAFRTQQSAVTALANWAAYTSTGTLTLCNFSLGWQSAAVWLNNGFAAQTGSFTVQFDATPNGAAIVGVVGLSAGAAGAYTDLAPIVAFNLAGQINARDGGAYAAGNVIPYTAGTSYPFRLLVDLPSRTYSAYVTPFGGAEGTIGSGYAFRTEQSAVTALANWAAYTSTGTLTLCNFSLGWQSAAVWLNNGFAAQTGSFTVQFDATPNGAAIAGVVGLSAGAAGAYTDLAPIVAFTLAGQINARDGGAYAAVNVIPYTAGTSYHFRLVVDLPSRTYSAYVTPFGGTEVTIGS